MYPSMAPIFEQNQSVNITEVSGTELKKLNLYYRGRTEELSKSVLSSKGKYKYATINLQIWLAWRLVGNFKFSYDRFGGLSATEGAYMHPLLYINLHKRAREFSLVLFYFYLHILNRRWFKRITLKFLSNTSYSFCLAVIHITALKSFGAAILTIAWLSVAVSALSTQDYRMNKLNGIIRSGNKY